MQFFARFETNRFAFRDGDLCACARVTPNATLARFNDEHTETAKLNALATLNIRRAAAPLSDLGGDRGGLG